MSGFVQQACSGALEDVFGWRASLEAGSSRPAVRDPARQARLFRQPTVDVVGQHVV